MKKITNLVSGKALMLCVFALFSISTVFATDYDLWVAGTQVTSDNCNDILNDGGKVKYDASANTLTLTDATIDAPKDDYGISCMIQDTKIVVNGTNTIKVLSGASWCIGVSLRYNGSILAGTNNAVLNIQGKNSGDKELGFGIYLEKGTAIIDGGSKGLTINIEKPKEAGIKGSEKNLTAFYLKSVNININAEDGSIDQGAIWAINDLIMEGCKITYPANVHYSGSAVVSNIDGAVYKGALKIEKAELKTYPLYVCGRQVTENNCNNVLGKGGIWYDDATKTLTLSDANIQYEGDVINFYAAGMTLNLKGVNKAVATNGIYTAISAEYGLNITGSGSLRASGNTGIWSGALNISGGCTVDAWGQQYAVSCSGEELTVNASTLKAESSNASIIGVNKLNLIDCAIQTNHTYDATAHKFLDALGNEAKGQIVIGQSLPYDLLVAGIQVNSANCKDVLNDGGSVKYDNATKTLTITNVNISAPEDENGITNRISGLKIVVNGTNTILTESGSIGVAAVYTTRPCYIVSGGPGAVINAGTCGKRYGYGIVASSSSDITIDGGEYDLTLNLTNPDWAGIYAYSIGSVIIRNTNVNITTKTSFKEGAIDGVTKLTLEDCSIVSPEGAKFDEAKKAVVDKDGNILQGDLTIKAAPGSEVKKYAVYVKEVQVTSLTCKDILNDGGSVKYDNATKTLTLNNAAISFNGDCINFYDKDMTIFLEGDNSISATGVSSYGLSAEYGLNITGPGHLAIVSEVTGIYTDGLSLSGGCVVEISADFYGVACMGDELVVDASTLKTEGKDASFSSVYKLTLIGCAIQTNHTYDETSHKFLNADGSEATDQIVIAPAGMSAIETVDNAQCTMHKYIRDGQLYIEKDGRTFNVLGTEVK